ncbi:GntR family transcriptional regulator [Nocardioides sp. CF8]|nr:GntR family transcriptional regulator [Nocardioides sp. CF8]
MPHGRERAQRCRRHEVAQVAGERQSDALQRDPDLLTLPGGRAMPLGGEQTGRQVEPCRNIPSWEHGVDRSLRAFGAGDEREAGARLHGVVHGGAAGAQASQLHVDEILSSRAECFEPEVWPALGVADQNAASGTSLHHEVGNESPSLRTGYVDLDGALAPVEAGPVEARAVGREWPTATASLTAKSLHADHLGAELVQPHEYHCVGGWPDASARDHLAILDGLRNRAPQVVRTAMEEHINYIGELLIDHADLPDPRGKSS